jgi:hypothetical protein
MIHSAISQTWPMPGANWRYCLTGWNGQPAGYLELDIVSDTIISGNTYNIIQYAGQNNKPAGYMTLYTRYSNDTVYRYVNNREYLFFTYNLTIGDVYTTYRSAGLNGFWADSACTSILPLKVTEVSQVELDGLTLNKYVLQDTLFHYIYEGGYPEIVEYILIERVGVVNTYPFINTMEPAEDGAGCWLPTDWGVAELGKYTDENFEHVFVECSGVGIDKPANNNAGLNIYPNPAKDFIFIELDKSIDKPVEFSIYNLTGTLLLKKQKHESSFKIILSDFLPGYYYMSIKPNSNPGMSKKIPFIITN